MIAQDFQPVHCPLQGVVFIEASAGTGKTHSITSIVMRLLLEKNLQTDQILLVTYTNAATDELRRKLRARLTGALDQLARKGGPKAPDQLIDDLIKHRRIDRKQAVDHLRNVLLTFDDIAIHTIHGFCQRVLLDHAFESGHLFNSELLPDESRLLEQVVLDFWRQTLPEQPARFFAYMLSAPHRFEELNRLAASVSRRRDVAILPRPQRFAIAETEEAFQAKASLARKMLAKERKGIAAAILECETRNRRVYYQSNVERWLGQIDQWLRSPAPLPSQLSQLKYCTTAHLAEQCGGESAPKHPFFDCCDGLMQLGTQMEDQLGQLWIQTKRDLLDFIQLKLPELKNRENAFSYDDLLSHTLEALEQDAHGLPDILAKKFPVILVDEFQDTDPTQYAIFQRIHEQADHQLLCLIGDPKQAIYGFRGGDVFTYTHARSQADYLATLRENWRSTPGLITAINTIYGESPRPFRSNAIKYHKVLTPAISSEERGVTLEGTESEKPPLQIWHLNVDGVKSQALQKTCAEMVCREAARLIALGKREELIVNGRPLAPSDLAVLIRYHYQAQIMQEALHGVGIKSVSYDRHHIFDTPEADQFEAFLNAMASPRDENALKAMLLGDFIGLDETDLLVALADDARWSMLLERYAAYRQLWSQQGFIVMFRHFLREENVPRRLLAQPNGERRLTNVLHLSELVEEAQSQLKLSPGATLKWFGDQRASLLSEERELRLESDDDRVKILTIHRSKGLEFPFVFLPFAWKGHGGKSTADFVSFHKARDDAWHRLVDVGSSRFDEHAELARREEAAEELRMTYVALTRAQHRLYLCWAVERSYKRSSLAYLWHHREGDQHRSLEDFENRLDAQAPTRLREDVRRLMALSQGTIVIKPPDQRPSAPTPLIDKIPRLKARSFQGRITRHWGITSYSALAGHGEGLEQPDHDLYAARQARADDGRPPEGMFALPRGTRVGNLLHGLYEKLSFQSEQAALRPLVDVHLAANGFDPREWGGIVASHLAHLLETDLGGFRLAEVADDRRLNELEFHFPIGSLTTAAFIAFFEKHKLPEAARALRFAPVEGFMKGFIDLIFQHGGRFHLLDYKSNHLGNSPEDYEPSRLSHAMAEGNYILQYHLYTIALHRYLQSRLGAAYDYERHMGDVFYLFVRGVSPNHPAGCGIYRSRPERVLIEELSAFLQRGTP